MDATPTAARVMTIQSAIPSASTDAARNNNAATLMPMILPRARQVPIDSPMVSGLGPDRRVVRWFGGGTALTV